LLALEFDPSEKIQLDRRHWLGRIRI